MRTLRTARGPIELPGTFAALPAVTGAEPPPLGDAPQTLKNALARPLGHAPLADFIEPGDRVTVIVAEGTNALEAVALPTIVAALEAIGASSIAVRRVMDGGRALLRTARDESSILTEETYEAVGRLERGVARMAREVARADKLVVLGASSFHALLGYCGGAELLAPGCADDPTAAAIWRSAFSTSGGRELCARAGELAGNPVQRAIARVVSLGPPVFLVELAMQRGERPAAIFAGELQAAHEEASRFHARWHRRTLPRRVDFAIVPTDPGAAAQVAALESCATSVAPGGTIVLVENAGAVAAEEPLDPACAAALLLRDHATKRRCVLVGAREKYTSGLLLIETLEEAAELVASKDGILLPDGARTLLAVESDVE